MSSRATISSMSTYAILGCGSVGHAVAEELVERGKDVLIVDKDESRVEALRDQDLNAQVANVRDQEVAELIDTRDVVLVMASDVDANEAAVENIRARNDDQFVVVRASDPVTSDELTELGADVVINPSSVISDAALRALESGELEYKARQLADVVSGTESGFAIITHDSPDPDSIAAAAALQAVAGHLGVDAEILYFGDIGHQENRAFVNLLDIELTPYSDVDIDNYDTIALVDPAKAGAVSIDRDVDIFIDHYELEDESLTAEFADVRPSVSATSTILTKYIQEFDLSVSQTVATALLYGIRAETLDFRRDTTPADLTAAAYLYPFADHDTLEQVESPNMSPETLDVLAEAIASREVQGSHLVSNAGFISDRDALSQAASQLLNLEGITTTAVFGIVDDTIYLDAQSKDIRLNIGRVLADAFVDIGDSAGHSTQASAEIPLGIFTGIETTEENRETLLDLTEEAVTRKLFDAMGVESESSNNGN
ncbi:DHH family phosphoesterase [Halobacterium salinarum]|uniref:DHH family phosphoesterase n=1 Tax=Halobacterium TaxID=2239 RepID=UPI0019645DC1|nr:MULTISPECIES: DHH family phosphoesterase [Halobacterium]MCF2165572.1 NAD-binding protein [Halobacterium salinarum]MCF2168340.1 NAD-binding protein [Halobacterium salinarum]MCF2239490.1 NAD-binding protein [Halobacterium salinarum]MDL0138230.1 DHH family phosphoesterase [Halobacterium salinarum]QRY23441.1 NAD-binding protein [Halobacterium sp. GSL-19]